MPVVIHGRILRFVEQNANLGFAGTRDRDLVPCGHRVAAWRVGANHRTITAFVADQHTNRMIESLEENGEVALTIEEFPSHETYQFKGRYLRHRPIAPEDLEIVARTRARFVKSVQPIYADVPEQLLKSYIVAPKTAVEFELVAIYLQTPGPGAGSRLVPPEDVLPK